MKRLSYYFPHVIAFLSPTVFAAAIFGLIALMAPEDKKECESLCAELDATPPKTQRAFAPCLCLKDGEVVYQEDR